MTQAETGNTVKVHYKGMLDNGQVFDSSEGKEPLSFTVGHGTLIKGFENAVIGMAVGEEKEFTVEPDDGYGERNEDLIIDINRNDIPSHIDVSIGQRLQIQQPNGEAISVAVTDMTEEKVTLDANHPLAGQDLTFKVEVMEIA